MRIHPTATVLSGAELGHDVEIGPYASIGERVQIEAGCMVGSRAVLEGRTRIAKNSVIGRGAVVGSQAQLVSPQEGASGRTTIGEGVRIGDYVTIHASATHDSLTTIGPGCHLMGGCHVGHNVTLGSGVTVHDLCLLGGHVEIGDATVLGAASVYHQFLRVGSYCEVAARTRGIKDIPPYLVVQEAGFASGIHLEALESGPFSEEDILQITQAVALVYQSGLNVFQALEVAKGRMWNEKASTFFGFITASRRGICRMKSEAADSNVAPAVGPVGHF